MTRATPGKVDRMYRHLSAKEKAKLLLRWWSEGVQEEAALVEGTSPAQREEVNAYIGAAMQAHAALSGLTLWLGERLTLARERYTAAALLQAWLDERELVRWLVASAMPEVVTEHEYEERLQALRGELLGVEDAAVMLSELEEDGVSDQQEWERRIRAAAAAGTLALAEEQVGYGALADWLGWESSVRGENGLPLAIVPDEESGAAETARLARETILSLGAKEPSASFRELLLKGALVTLGESEVSRRTLEAVAAWLVEDFDGANVVHRQVREQMEEIAAGIERLRVMLGEQERCEVELPAEADERLTTQIKELIAGVA